MAANTTPIFVKQGNIATARLVATNINTDGTTGTYYDLIAGATDGTRVDGVKFTSSGTAGTFNAKVMRVFICDNVVGNTNIRLIGEIANTAMTNNIATTTNIAARPTGLVTFDQPIILKSTQKLVVTMSQTIAYAASDQMDAIAYAGDY